MTSLFKSMVTQMQRETQKSSILRAFGVLMFGAAIFMTAGSTIFMAGCKKPEATVTPPPKDGEGGGVKPPLDTTVEEKLMKQKIQHISVLAENYLKMHFDHTRGDAKAIKMDQDMI